ncbi:MAG: hypothetical protein PHE74_02855 [Comamonas sp.]|nr:hypothetical protein [Comamonas sp.]
MSNAHSSSTAPATPASSSAWLRWVFWLLLIGFLAWDVMHSAPVDMRFEPPLLAAGSGQSSVGGHCSMPD